MDVVTLPLDRIEVGDRLRKVDEAEAVRIANSFHELGQITPIEVGPADAAGRHPLICGAHRLQAAVHEGWASIDAVVIIASGDAARLREIDENLYRRELSPYDRAASIAERIDILERLHGGKRKGGRPKKTAANMTGVSNWLRETAEQFELSLRDVRRAVEWRREITLNLWRALAGTPFVSRGSDLTALRRLSKQQQDMVAIHLMKRPPAPGAKLREVLARIDGLNWVRPDTGDGFDKLMSAWRHATPSAQRRFTEFLIKEGAIGE